MPTDLERGPSSRPPVPTSPSILHYHLGSLRITSEIPLPELIEREEALTCDVRIRMANTRAEALAEPRTERKSCKPDGSVWNAVHRVQDDWFIDFPAAAGFLIAGDGSVVWCYPVPEAAMAMVRHLLLNQIMPLVMSARGTHTLHASAVEVDGQAAIFAGASGKGKSTLALHFAMSGNRFLADDLVVIERMDRGLTVLPSYPSLRVCSDTLGQAGGRDFKVAPGAGNRSKARISAGQEVPFLEAPAPFGAIYLLGADAHRVKIRRVTGMESIIELVRASFVLDTSRTGRLEAHLEWVAAIAATGRLFWLDYPRDFASLSGTSSAVRQHLRNLDANG